MRRTGVRFVALPVLAALAVLTMAVAGCSRSDDKDSGSPGNGGKAESTSPTSTSEPPIADPAEVDPCELLTNATIESVLATTVEDDPKPAARTNEDMAASCVWNLGSYVAPADGVVTDKQTATLMAPGNGTLSVRLLTPEQLADATEAKGYTRTTPKSVPGLTILVRDADDEGSSNGSFLARRGVAVYVDFTGGVVPGTGDGPPACRGKATDDCDPEGSIVYPDGAGTTQLLELYTAVSTALAKI